MTTEKTNTPLFSNLSIKAGKRFIALRLKALKRLPLRRAVLRMRYRYKSPGLVTNVFGIDFPNPLGLAPGLDFNAMFLDELSIFGFSFLEIDCNNINKALDNIKLATGKAIKVASIDVAAYQLPLKETVAESRKAFSLIYDFVDMFVICVKDPDTLPAIIDPMLDTRVSYDSYKPMVVKILPETPDSDIMEILKYCMLYGIDGIMTPVSCIKKVCSMSNNRITVIASGNILTPQDAAKALDDGASLIELSTDILKKGHKLVRRMLKHLDPNISR